MQKLVRVRKINRRSTQKWFTPIFDKEVDLERKIFSILTSFSEENKIYRDLTIYGFLKLFSEYGEKSSLEVMVNGTLRLNPKTAEFEDRVVEICTFDQYTKLIHSSKINVLNQIDEMLKEKYPQQIVLHELLE